MNNPRITKRRRGFWILGFDCGPVGPYKYKYEAEEDLRGLIRWYNDDEMTLF